MRLPLIGFRGSLAGVRVSKRFWAGSLALALLSAQAQQGRPTREVAQAVPDAPLPQGAAQPASAQGIPDAPARRPLCRPGEASPRALGEFGVGYRCLAATRLPKRIPRFRLRRRLPTPSTRKRLSLPRAAIRLSEGSRDGGGQRRGRHDPSDDQLCRCAVHCEELEGHAGRRPDGAGYTRLRERGAAAHYKLHSGSVPAFGRPGDRPERDAGRRWTA